MTRSERRKIYCSVLFHLIAIACMLWSVYILVKRTTEEIRLGRNGQYFPHVPHCITDTHEVVSPPRSMFVALVLSDSTLETSRC